MSISKDEWLALFEKANADTRKDQMLVVLNNLDGYAVEYGIDEDNDAEDLITAFDAITEKWSNK